MAKFYSLFSGSKGNASIVRSGKQSLLIDAGMSCKQVISAMLAHDIPECSVSGILITHTHSDHIKGLRVLCKRLGTRVYATEGTMTELLRAGHITDEYFGGIFEEKSLDIGGFSVRAFPTEHDSEGSCGYRIETPEERVCSVCTDLGHVTDEVHKGVKGSDLVLLESNYDPVMLKNGSYPLCLKARIAGREGHLSNVNCGEEAVRLIDEGTTRLILGHLSEENNTPFLARKTVTEYLDRDHKQGVDYLLYVADRTGLEKAVIF
ncbi:MAG: MBL fold metallo-hydrolase [Ruminococcus sp.]